MTVALGIPSHSGTIHTVTQRAIMGCLGLFHSLCFLDGCSDLCKARNSVVAQFLHGECDRLLFVDTDMDFTRTDVERLLSHDVDVVAGVYPAKRPDDGRPMVWPQPDRIYGLQQVRRAATGLMAIKRSVFSRLRDHWGDRLYHDETWGSCYDYFPGGIELRLRDTKGRLMHLSDDYAFCELCAAAGVEVWADLSVQLGHVGPVTYRIRS